MRNKSRERIFEKILVRIKKSIDGFFVRTVL